MIIVNQNKNVLVNFDNVVNVNIENCHNGSINEEDFTFDILVYTESSELVRMGQYKTEERAKEILQEIVQVYVNGKKAVKGNTFFSGFEWLPPDTLYEMPLE